MRAWLALAASAVTAAVAFGVNAQVLRVVPHSNLNILDPIWTTQYMARNHGYMVYDTLFGTDEKSRIQPQMVDKWSVSPDNRLWSFTLREGLEFHDGKPVSGEDVIASLRRWGQRDAMGQKLMTFVERMDSPAPNQFRIFLREPCGFVLEALGKPSSNVPFIMPKRVAETPADKQIEDAIGSGPYIFKRDEFKPGDRAVYVKNEKYRPRKETPSGTAGGKHVFVERVEWNLALRDAQSQVNALAKGEVDVIERPAFESYEQLKQISDVPAREQGPARLPVHVPLQPPASAVQQCEGAPGGARGDAAGAFPARPGRHQGVLPPLRLDVHLQYALRQPEGQRGAIEVQHEESSGAPEELRATTARRCSS